MFISLFSKKIYFFPWILQHQSSDYLQRICSLPEWGWEHCGSTVVRPFGAVRLLFLSVTLHKCYHSISTCSTIPKTTKSRNLTGYQCLVGDLTHERKRKKLNPVFGILEPRMYACCHVVAGGRTVRPRLKRPTCSPAAPKDSGCPHTPTLAPLRAGGYQLTGAVPGRQR